MSVSPFIPNPVTDFLFILAPQFRLYNGNPLCSKLESRLLDCLDAYGTLRAREKCAELMYDLVECSNHIAQRQRVQIMVKERMKQYREGKRSKPFEQYPALDSYLNL